MGDAKSTIRVEADPKAVQKGLKDAESALGHFADVGERGFKRVADAAKNIEERIKSHAMVEAWNGLSGLVGQTSAALSKSVEMLGDYVKTSIEADQTSRRLSMALRQQGADTGAHRAEVKKLNIELQDMFGFSSGALEEAETLLLNLGVSAESLGSSMKHAVGAAVVTGKELQDSAKAVAEALAGETGGLKELGISASTGREALQRLNETFREAVKEADNTATRVRKLSSSYDDFKAAIGGVFAESDAGQRTITTLERLTSAGTRFVQSDFFQWLVEKEMALIDPHMKVIESVLGGTVDKVEQARRQAEADLEETRRISKLGGVTQLELPIEEMKEEERRAEDLKRKRERRRAEAARQRSERERREDEDLPLEQLRAWTDVRLGRQGQDVLAKQLDEPGAWWGSAPDDLVESIKQGAVYVKQAELGLSDAFAGAIGTAAEGFSGLFSQLAASVGEGENVLSTLKKFLGGLIMTVGEYLIQIGTAAAIIGPLSAILGPLAGPFAGLGAGAGIALIATGGAIVAAGAALSSSGGGKGASSRTSTPSTSAPSRASKVANRSGGSVLDQFQAMGGGGGDTIVNINFTGTVTNPRRTARELQDLLENRR